MNPTLKIAKICSPEAYDYLQKWLNSLSPNLPAHAQTKVQDSFYKNTSHRMYLSKFIESVIVRMLKKSGFDPVKAEDKGKYIDERRTYVDVIGRHRVIGSAKYIPASRVHKGRADIKCFAWGKMWNFEVKVGGDTMKAEQIAEQERALAAGERYCVIKTIDDWIEIWKKNN